MYKIKGLIIVATLVVLILMPGLACYSWLPPEPPPAAIVADAPNYYTYNDSSGVFSIDVPVGWEASRYEGQSFSWGTYAKDGLNRLQSGLPVQSHYTIFAAYKRVQHHIVASVYIDVRAVFWPKPYTIDDEAESRARTHPDFKELSRTETTVDGREATVWAWEGTFPEADEQAPSYHLEQYLATDKAVWIVKCSVDSDNVSEWQNEFETIAGSLKINY